MESLLSKIFKSKNKKQVYNVDKSKRQNLKKVNKNVGQKSSAYITNQLRKEFGIYRPKSEFSSTKYNMPCLVTHCDYSIENVDIIPQTFHREQNVDLVKCTLDQRKTKNSLFINDKHSDMDAESINKEFGIDENEVYGSRTLKTQNPTNSTIDNTHKRNNMEEVKSKSNENSEKQRYNERNEYFDRSVEESSIANTDSRKESLQGRYQDPCKQLNSYKCNGEFIFEPKKDLTNERYIGEKPIESNTFNDSIACTLNNSAQKSGADAKLEYIANEKGMNNVDSHKFTKTVDGNVLNEDNQNPFTEELDATSTVKQEKSEGLVENKETAKETEIILKATNENCDDVFDIELKTTSHNEATCGKKEAINSIEKHNSELDMRSSSDAGLKVSDDNNQKIKIEDKKDTKKQDSERIISENVTHLKLQNENIFGILREQEKRNLAQESQKVHTNHIEEDKINDCSDSPSQDSAIKHEKRHEEKLRKEFGIYRPKSEFSSTKYNMPCLVTHCDYSIENVDIIPQTFHREQNVDLVKCTLDQRKTKNSLFINDNHSDMEAESINKEFGIDENEVYDSRTSKTQNPTNSTIDNTHKRNNMEEVKSKSNDNPEKQRYNERNEYFDTSVEESSIANTDSRKESLQGRYQDPCKQLNSYKCNGEFIFEPKKDLTNERYIGEKPIESNTFNDSIACTLNNSAQKSGADAKLEYIANEKGM
ncbi:uncharacterized protein LOC113472022, partial [Diaphorina citri]|uniref:Uncharacterized protein LOC113472022 n=1 Tax=Diaphorina citri TaxID=121845 RepID=A0A3Q0JFY4_DIACI